MRIKIKTPEQHNHQLMWICLWITSILFVAGFICLYNGANGEIATVAQTVRNGLEAARQEDLCLFFCVLALGAAICLGPFAAAFAILRYYYKNKGLAQLTFMTFSQEGLLLESSNPAQTNFFPYQDTQLEMEVITYIRRGRKGAVRRCIDRITLTFHSPEKDLSFSQVGALPFICQVLDFVPRFQHFSAYVHSRNSYLTDPMEKDLVQYVKDQIHNYRTYGKILRYSVSQRKEVRLTGWMLLMVGIGLVIVLGPILYDMKKAGHFLLLLAVLIPSIVLFGLSFSCFYRVHQDIRLEKEIKSSSVR